MDFDFIALVPALIGAVGGSVGGSIGGILISDFLKRRNERENLRKNITSKYLIQLEYALESLDDRLNISLKEFRGDSDIPDELFKDRENINYKDFRVGSKKKIYDSDGKIKPVPGQDSETKGNIDYYIVSTLYALGTVLSYDKILLFEGIYTQLDDLHRTYGYELRSGFLHLGDCLERIRMETPSGIRYLLLYERIALGDALTVKENGNLTISSYLDFKQRYETDSQFRLSLEPVREFVEKLDLDSDELQELREMVKTMVELVYEKSTNIMLVPK